MGTRESSSLSSHQSEALRRPMSSSRVRTRIPINETLGYVPAPYARFCQHPESLHRNHVKRRARERNPLQELTSRRLCFSRLALFFLYSSFFFYREIYSVIE
jgi:hypothetical protein